jgi:MoaA/NifB/PqqE/SkfB family radical SAM enzyme
MEAAQKLEVRPEWRIPTPAMQNTASLLRMLPNALWHGTRFTPRRVQNLIRARSEERLGATRLESYPIKLTIEATNVCNLRCPACFTGVESKSGRSTRPMDLALYEPLIDELGPYAFEVEFHNWGEPLLARHICTMVARAHAHGASTTISTNFSIPFDDMRAEALVQSGLTILGVSLDGATQASYEQYRKRGNLALSLRNVERVRDAKRRLGSPTPRMIWEYHVFSHNTHEIERARRMAEELEMDIAVEKGWVAGTEWDQAGQYRFYADPKPQRCDFLWYQAVINNDGGVAPCCGSFYPEDDFARISAESLRRQPFHEVWNAPALQQARRLFRHRSGSPALQKSICYDCPSTVIWERFKGHLASHTGEPFEIGVTTNDKFNHFWNRRTVREGLVQLSRPGGSSRSEPK